MAKRAEPSSQPEQQLDQIAELLESGTFKQVRLTLRSLAPGEIAHLILSSPPPSRTLLWELIDKPHAGEVLEALPTEIKNQFLKRMNTEDVVALTEGLEADDIADILQSLPEKVIVEVLQAMSLRDRERVSKVLGYAEDTAGGLTNPDAITVRARINLDVVLRYLRRHGELPPSTDNIFVVDKNDEYIGTLSLAKILTTDLGVAVGDVMRTDIQPIPAEMPDSEVARLFETHDWVSAPVVDADGRLIGRITIDDVVDVILEDTDRSLMNLAGLDEDEDTFATVWRTTPRRAIWLGANLVTALLASSAISQFQDTLDKVVALAVLMPIVASMGGVAGSQTLTVVIRGIALGQINRSNLKWLVSREVSASVLNGCLWAGVLAVVTSWWFNDTTLGSIIACALAINLVTAAFAGALIPVFLKSCKIDPALAGGMTLMAVTDVVGFCAFLGLATYYYA